MILAIHKRSLFTRPSFYAHIFGGFLLLVAILVLFINYKNFTDTDTGLNAVYILLLVSIASTLHGLSHQGLERHGCPCKRGACAYYG